MRLAERLATAMAAGKGGGQPDADDMDIPVESALTPAAVLIALTERDAPGLILTQRTEHLRRHAGQIAFPGGRRDPEDRDAIATALREAQEEIALDPAEVTVAGLADRYRTGTGFAITPVLATIPPDLPLVAAEDEVASVFEVPAAYLFDPANQRHASAVWRGRERRFYEIVWEDRRIWGATAAMIVALSRRLEWR